MPDRAVASPVAVVLLLVVVVVAAGALGAAALGLAETPTAPTAVVVAADASPSGRVTLVHRGGPALAVRDLDVRVTVDGTPLDRQPPVPFFSARGFESGPTGPFNSASDPRWSAGESASFRVAATNDPPLVAGATVRVELVYRDRPVTTVSVTVGSDAGVTGDDTAGAVAGLDRPPPDTGVAGRTRPYAGSGSPYSGTRARVAMATSGL